MSRYKLLLRGHQEQMQPWCRLWQQGHGDIWFQHAEYTDDHLAVIKSALLDAG